MGFSLKRALGLKKKKQAQQAAPLPAPVTAPTLETDKKIGGTKGFKPKHLQVQQAFLDQENEVMSQKDGWFTPQDDSSILDAVKNPMSNKGKLLRFFTSRGASRGRFAHEKMLDPSQMSGDLKKQQGSATEQAYDPFAEMKMNDVNDTTQAAYNQMQTNMLAMFALDEDRLRANDYEKDDEDYKDIREMWDNKKVGKEAALKAFSEDPREAVLDGMADEHTPGEPSYAFQLVVNLPTESYMTIQKAKTGNMMRKKRKFDNDDKKKKYYEGKFLEQVKSGAGYKALLKIRKSKASQNKQKFKEDEDHVLQAYVADQYQLSENATTGECGHTFVRFKRKKGGVTAAQYSFGFWPGAGVNGATDVMTGEVQNPDRHSSDHAENEVVEEKDVSKTQAINATTYIRSIIGSAHSYSFAGYNCTSFGMEVAQAAGISPKNAHKKMTTDTKYHQRVESPAVLAESYGVFEERAREIDALEGKPIDTIVSEAINSKHRSALYTRVCTLLEGMGWDDSFYPLHKEQILRAVFTDFATQAKQTFGIDVEGTAESVGGNSQESKNTRIRNALMSNRVLDQVDGTKLRTSLIGFIRGAVIENGYSFRAGKINRSGTGNTANSTGLVNPCNYKRGTMTEFNYMSTIDSFALGDFKLFSNGLTNTDINVLMKLSKIPLDDLCEITKDAFYTALSEDSRNTFKDALPGSMFEIGKAAAKENGVKQQFVDAIMNAQAKTA